MSDLNSQSDTELAVASLQHKDSFAVLIMRYEASLARYIHRLGVTDHEDVLDVLQETFIAVYKNLNEYDSSLKFSSWMYRIAHNKTVDWFRKRRVRPEGHLIEDGESVLPFVESPEWGSEAVFDASLNSTVLSQALAKLDPKYREVVVLRFFEEKEYDEISDILKIPIGSVGTLLHRAKKELRKFIDTKHIRI